MPRNASDQKARLFRRGQRTIPARQINQLVEGINKPLVGVNSLKQSDVLPKGGSSVSVFYFVSDEGDYLICEDESENQILVAKPYELRRTPFDGETVNGISYTYTSNSERSADDGEDQEDQFITPDYVAGGEIYATKPKKGTGVETDDEPPAKVKYLEVDQGRTWATPETEEE